MELVYIIIIVLVIVLFGSTALGLTINSASVALGGLLLTIVLLIIFMNTIVK
jgi:hypothetical protein